MLHGPVRPFSGHLIGRTALVAILLATSAQASAPTALSSVQTVIDDLKAQLQLPVEVAATLVPSNPLLVSVEPDGNRTFVMRFQEDFLEGLEPDEVRAIVAHELGHVWIFTHHPYLQTERGANAIALRVVAREQLEQVYDKVWSHSGIKGNLSKFLPAQH